MTFLDFNTATPQGVAPQAPQPSWQAPEAYDRDEVKASLLAQLEGVLGYLYPHGFSDPKGQIFYLGNIQGDPGESLRVELQGEKAGLWWDFAAYDGGDIFDLWKAARGLPSFREVIKDAAQYSGAVSNTARRMPKRKQPKGGEAWGAPTITHQYHDTRGNIIAEVDRFEWEEGGKRHKVFRPWDVATRRHKAPETRPLYNLPRISSAPEIVVVEGEKAADALIAQHIDATTAMGGASAPMEKTDWSPLKGRKVIIWPDNDAPGKAYAERLKAHLEAEGVVACSILTIPPARPEKWDAADAVNEDLGALIRAMRPTGVEVAKIDLEWFDDITASLSDAYMVKGVLGAGTMSVVYGPSNSGKTFFAIDLAMHIASETEWRGRRVNGAAVLYLAAEGGKGVANRVASIKAEWGLCGVPFALRRAGMDLLNRDADLKAIIDMAAEVRQRSGKDRMLIVIDTLSRVMAGGDENSAADMTALIRNIDLIREATGAHIMLVHHTGKDTARGARGHSSLRAATDTEIEVQNEDGNRAAIVTKQRDYQGGETFAFELKPVHLGYDQDGDEVSSCVIKELDEGDFKKARKKFTKNQKVLVETFDALAETVGTDGPGGPMMPEPGRFVMVQMDAFRQEAEGKLTAKNTRDAFLTAFDALLGNDGVFCMASGFVWRHDRENKK